MNLYPKINDFIYNHRNYINKRDNFNRLQAIFYRDETDHIDKETVGRIIYSHKLVLKIL